jgi:hypothetical protein
MYYSNSFSRRVFDGSCPLWRLVYILEELPIGYLEKVLTI